MNVTKNQLTEATNKNYDETKTALQTVFDNLNKGQQQKILKVKEVKELFERYEIITE